MPPRRTPSLTPDEARKLHHEALVIDTQQPPATNGFLFTEKMGTALAEHYKQGMTREEAAPLMVDMASREIRTSEAARKTYLDFWRTSGVTIACGTYSGSMKITDAFEAATKRIAQGYGYIDALGGALGPGGAGVGKGADIERVHHERKFGLLFDFQNTTPFAENLDRIDYFHGLGVRMVQLTYNLRNLVGDGCTEAYQGGLSHFGREVVRRLNELKVLV